MPDVFYDDSDNLIMVTGLFSNLILDYLDDSGGTTVQVWLQDASGVNLPGIVWPVNASYLANTQGDWRALVDGAALTIDPGDQIQARIVILSGGYRRTVVLPLTVTSDA